MFKKLLISLLAGIILLMTLSVPTFAAGLVGAPGPWYSQSFDQWYTKVYGGDQNQIFGERYTNAQVNWIFWSMVSLGINLASGNSPAVQQCIVASGGGNVSDCLTGIKAAHDGVKVTISDSGKNRSLFAAIFEDRSLSGVTYIKNIGRKFHLIPEAKAQSAGFGYTALNVTPDIQIAWQAM